MENSIEEILRNHYVDGTFHTHVSMIQPKGRFQLSRDGLESFWDIYCKVIKENFDDTMVGIAEKPQPYLPVLADIDIKIKDEGQIEFGDHLYTPEQVKQVISVYQAVLRATVDNCTDEQLLCVLLEKPIYYIGVGDNNYAKNGFHLHFPNLFLNKLDQEIHIIPRVQENIKQLETFKNLGIEDSSIVIDKACCKVPWLLYGSRKSEDMDSYKLTKIYASDGSELTLEEAFSNYKIYDENEKAIPIQNKIQDYLPRILSIMPYGRITSEFKTGLEVAGVEKIKPKQIRERKPMNLNLSEKVKLIQKLLPLLSESRAEDHGDWLKVGWIIHSETDGCDEGLDLWLEFSARCDEKYNEEACRDLWDKMEDKRDGVSMGTLHYYAKTDSPDEYKKIQRAGIQSEIDSCLRADSGDLDFARLFYKRRKETIKIVNKKNCKFYHWHPIKLLWFLEDDGGNTLKRLVSEELLPLVVEIQKEICDKMSITTDKAEHDALTKQMKLIISTVKKLKTDKQLGAIVSQIKTFDIDENFRKLINRQPDVVPIKDGMLVNLRTGEQRLRVDTDLFSFELNVKYNPEADFTKVETFFSEICCGSQDMVDYHKRLWGYSLTGETDDRGIHILWGEGKNGKSTLTNILGRILGEDDKFFGCFQQQALKKASKDGKTQDHLEPLINSRLCQLPESEEGEYLNESIIKTITGNDMLSLRLIYDKQISIRTQAKCIMPTNHRPVINIDDDAILARIKFIPFGAKFITGDEQDLTDEEKIKANKNKDYIKDIQTNEIDNFFSWFVKGAVEWYGGKKLHPTVEMTQDKKSYISEQDVVKEFINDNYDIKTEEEYDLIEKTKKQEWLMKRSTFNFELSSYIASKNAKQLSKIQLGKAVRRNNVSEKQDTNGCVCYILKQKDQEEIPEARVLGRPPM